MIRVKTAFILGAGSSMHAGFPSGRELVDLILNSEPELISPIQIQTKVPSSDFLTKKINNNSRKELYTFLNNLGYDKSKIGDFLSALNKSQMNSVDAFLERRPEFISIGKIFISYILNYFENPKRLYSNPDWYRYIWNKMNASFDDFAENKVSFITFNYDKSLKYYFLNGLVGISGKSMHECWNMFQKIPIIHLHGEVGFLTKDKPEFEFNYGFNLQSDFILNSFSQNIKIIHEKLDDDKEFSEAHDIINEAERIIFLGFGYNQINIDRLKLKNIPSGIISGSTIGLTQKEIDEIYSRNKNFQLSKCHEDTCEEYLRNNYSWG